MEIDALREQVAVNRADIDALLTRADANQERADASDARSAEDRLRIDDLEARADIDREMVLQLQAEENLSREQIAHLQEALRTSRRIGAAIGIIMANRLVGENDAFGILRTASQTSNRKVRDLADELVLTGDVSILRTA